MNREENKNYNTCRTRSPLERNPKEIKDNKWKKHLGISEVPPANIYGNLTKKILKSSENMSSKKKQRTLYS